MSVIILISDTIDSLELLKSGLRVTLSGRNIDSTISTVDDAIDILGGGNIVSAVGDFYNTVNRHTCAELGSIESFMISSALNKALAAVQLVSIEILKGELNER